uniref:Lipoprotein n=1 Tax=Panagrolaimus sp. JU765 TaxID=591449 RepID=A0AC34RPP6_9BILA
MKKILVVLVLLCVTCHCSPTLKPVDLTKDAVVLDLEEIKNDVGCFFNNLETSLVAALGRFDKHGSQFIKALVFDKLREIDHFFNGYNDLIAVAGKTMKYTDTKEYKQRIERCKIPEVDCADIAMTDHHVLYFLDDEFGRFACNYNEKKIE